jgi:hypothetical protein
MKELDEVYADTWARRDATLGEMTYADYLRSEHWALVRKKAAGRPNYQKCEFCDSLDIELHHTSYKWILTKHELRTVISLCRTHHQAVHDLAKASGASVRVATNLMRAKFKPDYCRPNRIR